MTAALAADSLCGFNAVIAQFNATYSAYMDAYSWIANISAHDTDLTSAPAVRAALDRILAERPGISAAYLFPSPDDPTRPIMKDLARKWLGKAEQLAELPNQPRGGWHSFRRKWATERKQLPLADVAQAGGWKSKETLLNYYQQADQASILRVVLGGDELRELKA